MISFCIVSKNRFQLATDDGLVLELLPNCLRSIRNVANSMNLDCEIIIADFESDDCDIEDLVLSILPDIKYSIVKVKGKFSRGKGRNIAFRHSNGDIIFFIDADMILYDDSVIRFGISFIESGFAYFPVCYSYYDHKNNNGWWRSTGFGNLIISRTHFQKYGWWQEKNTWGGEDDKMFMSLARNIPVIREKVSSFCHQWHPDAADVENRHDSFWRKIFRRIK